MIKCWLLNIISIYGAPLIETAYTFIQYNDVELQTHCHA